MTPAEILEHLVSAHTGIVTTVRRDGMPISTPVWFVVYDGAVYFGTPSKSKKAARLHHDAKIGFLVEGGKRWAELWAVNITGHATPVEAPEELEGVAAVQGEKYAGFTTPRSQYPDDAREFYERDNQRIVYRIDAEERILSWDNSKLRLSEPA